MPSFEEYKSRVQRVEYASQKLIKVENYFNKLGLDLIVERIDNEVFMILATNEPFRRIINFRMFNVRDVDIESLLFEFYDNSKSLLKKHEEESFEPSVRVQAHQDDEIVVMVNGNEIEVGEGQEVIITESGQNGSV